MLRPATQHSWGRTDVYDKNEEELKDHHLLFEESIASYIQEAKRKGEPTLQQGREFCEGSKPIPQDNFLEAIIGPDRAKKHLEKEVERLKRHLQQTPSEVTRDRT